MSILDDARKFAERGPETDVGECFYCAGVPSEHEPGCPWLAMPKIVAALEAAQAVADAYDQETAATGWALLGSPLLEAVDVLDKALKG